jgi:hypothetical protein
MEQVDELFMGVPVEQQLAAIGVQHDFQHAFGRAGQPGVGKQIPIVFEFRHHGLLLPFPLGTTGGMTKPYCRR